MAVERAVRRRGAPEGRKILAARPAPAPALDFDDRGAIRRADLDPVSGARGRLLVPNEEVEAGAALDVEVGQGEHGVVKVEEEVGGRGEPRLHLPGRRRGAGGE